MSLRVFKCSEFYGADPASTAPAVHEYIRCTFADFRRFESLLKTLKRVANYSTPLGIKQL